MEAKVLYADIPDEFVFDNTMYETSEKNNNYSDINSFRYVINDAPLHCSLEQNKWRLDGTYKTAEAHETIPYCSIQTSNDTEMNGEYNFSTQIIINCSFEITQRLSGITLIFDEECYSNSLQINCLYGDASVLMQTYAPDSSIYFCEFGEEIQIEKIEITFYSMNKANRYLRLFGIVPGKVTSFSSEQVVSISSLQEISILCTELPAHSIEIELKNTDLEFKKLNPLFVKTRKTGATFYIDTIDENDKTSKFIQGYNFISLLDYYTSNSSLPAQTTIPKLLKKNVLNYFPLRYILDDYFSEFSTSQYTVLPASTSREALLAVLSSLGAVYGTKENILKIHKDFSGEKYIINSEQIFAGAKIIRPTEKYNISIERVRYIAQPNDNPENEPHRKITAEDLLDTYYDENRRKVYRIHTNSSTPAYSITVLSAAMTEMSGVVSAGYTPYTIDIVCTEDGIRNILSHGYVWWTNATESTETIKLILNETAYDRINIHSKKIKSIYISTDGDSLQKERALKYYNQDVTFEGTIILPDALECGNRIYIDSPKYNYFDGIVEQIEYTYKGGQKMIGRVRAHAYG